MNVAQEMWIFLNKGGNFKKEQLHLKPACFVTRDSRDALPEFSNTTKRKWIKLNPFLQNNFRMTMPPTPSRTPDLTPRSYVIPLSCMNAPGTGISYLRTSGARSMSTNVLAAMQRGIQLCLDARGRHFQHILSHLYLTYRYDM